MPNQSIKDFSDFFIDDFYIVIHFYGQGIWDPVANISCQLTIMWDETKTRFYLIIGQRKDVVLSKKLKNAVEM